MTLSFLPAELERRAGVKSTLNRGGHDKSVIHDRTGRRVGNIHCSGSPAKSGRGGREEGASEAGEWSSGRAVCKSVPFFCLSCMCFYGCMYVCICIYMWRIPATGCLTCRNVLCTYMVGTREGKSNVKGTPLPPPPFHWAGLGSTSGRFGKNKRASKPFGTLTHFHLGPLPIIHYWSYLAFFDAAKLYFGSLSTINPW